MRQCLQKVERPETVMEISKYIWGGHIRNTGLNKLGWNQRGEARTVLSILLVQTDSREHMYVQNKGKTSHITSFLQMSCFNMVYTPFSGFLKRFLGGFCWHSVALLFNNFLQHTYIFVCLDLSFEKLFFYIAWFLYSRHTILNVFMQQASCD